MVWHKVGWEGSKRRGDRRHVLTGRTSKAPGLGTWVCTTSSTDGGQTTHESVAVDGHVVHTAVCYCGQHRAMFWTKAATYLKD